MEWIRVVRRYGECLGEMYAKDDGQDGLWVHVPAVGQKFMRFLVVSDAKGDESRVLSASDWTDDELISTALFRPVR